MPRRNKKPAPFMSFAMEYKNNHKRAITLDQAISQAGEIWKNMPEKEKSKYKSNAKHDFMKLTQKPQEVLNCEGVPVRYIEAEINEKKNSELKIKSQIRQMVKNSRMNDNFTKQKYFFVMGNYFVRYSDSSDVYLPAEIACSEFTLKDGINNKFHSFINPNVEIFGPTYEAQEHSNKTHMLPLPPNAFGDKNIGKIYTEILKFICNQPDGDENTKYQPPPIYTFSDNIPMITSMLKYMQLEQYSDDQVDIPVYPLQYLFYTLKTETAELAEIEPPHSIFLTNSILERDDYEYKANLSCGYHDEVDRTKYCALSCVVRWGFMIAHDLCTDLAIKAIPGQHCPDENHMSNICMSAPMLPHKNEKKSDEKKWSEITSRCGDRNIKNEPSTSGFNNKDEYPPLGRHKKSK